MVSLKSMNEEDLQKMVSLTPKVETKKGFIKSLFSKKKMEDKKVNEVKKEIVVEPSNEILNKDTVDEIKSNDEKITEVEVENKIKSNDEIITKFENEIKQQNDDIIEIPINNKLKEVNDCDKNIIAEYKIATFSIKVENKNVGEVLSKIGEYASQLNEMKEVEHCDLNIKDI